ncbi:nitrate/nitrite response regulator protein [Sulfuriferula multivorans]|uniref:Nitrate/nitrite response regulator protein n=1 Tax=Sulfuriferula multivorans TaxID=1559896 RepID=A0A401JDZ9_9PROT|nr:response regulator transcription factor [Sulfuriferula multivorans]GBL45881.1 nitrate/nitrite response regulator protein [Sulfuriferula multivorans]
MTVKIKVVLVDDHTLFRKGLAELLEHSGTISVAGITGDVEEARRMLREIHPDVVIMDLHMPAVDGITLLSQFHQEGLLFPTLILTVSDDQGDMANALRAGARGYLLKNMEPAEVVDAIQRAARGETVVAPTMTAKLVNLLDAKQGKKDSLIEQLTQREQQILGCLAKGESNKVIARNLGISHDTVKLHVHNIFSKLNLTSRVAAAVFAVEQRLGQSGTGASKS